MQNIHSRASVCPSASALPGSSSQTAVIAPGHLDHNFLQSSAHQSSVHQNGTQMQATALAQREIGPVATDAGQRVPGVVELCDLLCDLDDYSPVVMGIALGLPSHVLLRELRAYDRDAVKQVKSLLAASLPLSLAEVARRLEQGTYAVLGGKDIAEQLRSLIACSATDRLESLDLPLCDELVAVFLPLIAHSDVLGEVFGLPEARRLQLQAAAAPPTRWQLTRTIVDHDIRLRLERNLPARRCREWMAVMAQAGLGGRELEHVAWHWQLALPPDVAGWYGYAHYRVFERENALLEAHRSDHHAPVPLQQFVTFLRFSVLLQARDFGTPDWDLLSFPLAAGNDSDPRLFKKREWHELCLFSLLRHAVCQKGDGQHISGSLMCRLVRLGIAGEAVQEMLHCPAPVAQTHSRPLRPFDLLQLSQSRNLSRLDAIQVAALLGVGGEVRGDRNRHWAVIKSHSWHVQEKWGSYLSVWRWIYRRAPWLETGHLAHLFRRFGLGKQDLIRELTGAVDSESGPPAPPFPQRAVEFMDMAEYLFQQPGLVKVFLRRYPVDDYSCFRRVPTLYLYGGSGSNERKWRLLNALAADPLVLKNWRAFLADHQQVRRQRAADAESLELNAEGYPYDYVCPISLVYMDDPVAIVETCKNYNWYSRSGLMRALENHSVNPLTGTLLRREDVPEVDQEHLARIKAWRKKHPELEDEQDPTVSTALLRRFLCRLL